MQNQETQDGSSSELPSSDELSSASSSMWEDSEARRFCARGFPISGVAGGEAAGRPQLSGFLWLKTGREPAVI